MKRDGLPEGILFEIFLKLPSKSIHRFRCVSKVWLSILCDPGFMKTRFKTLLLVNETKPWAIFFNKVIPGKYHLPDGIKIPSKLVHTQLMSSSLDLSVYEGFSFSFLNESYGFNKEDHKLHVLASSNGLVLVSFIRYATEDASYFVCNPITEEFVSLPQPTDKSLGKFSYGLVCETYSSSSSAVASESTFKVVRTHTSVDGVDGNTGFGVEIYFLDLDEWRTYQVAYLEPLDYTHRFYSKSNVITHNGVMYWFQEGGRSDKIVAYDLKTNNYECDSHNCSALDVPMAEEHYRYNSSNVCLGVSEDSVCYGKICDNSTLRIWQLMEDGHSIEEPVWSLRHEIELLDFKSTKIQSYRS